MWVLKKNYLQYKTKNFNILTTTRKIFCNKNNLAEVLKKINIPKNLNIITCEQVHGNKVNHISHLTSHISQLKNSDGIITNNHNIAICIFTADCVPLFIYSEENKIFGLVHIGRKGLLAGITENVTKLLSSKKLCSNYFRDHIYVTDFTFILGPHICKKCYSVDGKSFSLKKEIVSRLVANGVNKRNIITSNYCTYHNNNLFFSYRHGDDDKRIVSVIYNETVFKME